MRIFSLNAFYVPEGTQFTILDKINKACAVRSQVIVQISKCAKLYSNKHFS